MSRNKFAILVCCLSLLHVGVLESLAQNRAGCAGTASCSCAHCDAFGSGMGADSVMPETSNLYSGSPVGADFAQAQETGAPIVSGGPAASDFAGLGTGFGATAATDNIPDMIGDFFFGSGYTYGVFSGGVDTTVAIAGGDRRFKWSDNNSPFPRNRFFFNYHQFADAVQDIVGRSQSVDRYTFGMEKTIFDGLASVEVRAPFASTVSSTQMDFEPDGTIGTEFGNISLAVKGLVVEKDRFVVAVGVGMVFPTGDDSVVVNDSGTGNEIEFGNDSYSLQPFVGAYFAPNQYWFTQFFSQMDFALNGNELFVPANSGLSLTAGPASTSVLQDQTLLAFDYSMGRWFYFDRCFIRRIAPMLELHYTTTLQNRDEPDFVNAINPFVPENRRDVLNITGGLYWELNSLTAIKIAGAAPLRDKPGDRLFDHEFGVQVTRRY